jgi:hypothetical protein
VTALNSDTVIGRKFPGLLLQKAGRETDRTAFYAIPVFDAEPTVSGLKRTRRLQAEVTALTWYISCMPVRAREIRSGFVLGPPGPAVIMTREFIREMTVCYGFVYNPEFFLYGEDVDLFLRARQHGFETRILDGQIDREDVIWHVGSATASDRGVRTLDKSPEVAGRVLAGCLRNARTHAGALEWLPVLILQLCFRVVFCALYARKHSLWAAWRVAWARSRSNGSQRCARHSGRTMRPFLLPLAALLYRRPFPWARGPDVAGQSVAQPAPVRSSVR